LEVGMRNAEKNDVMSDFKEIKNLELMTFWM